MINGIETLYRLIEDNEGCQAKINNDSLEIEIQDTETFLRYLVDRIRSMQDMAIFCTKLDVKGQKRYIKKDYVKDSIGQWKQK